MNSLRKISSLLRLRRKQDTASIEIFNPILEDSSEEEIWPVYNPSAYKSVEEPQKMAQHSRQNEQAELEPSQARNILPGAPPKIYEEGDRLYDLDRGIIASLEHLNWEPVSHNSAVQETIYGDAELSLFGPQFGLSKSARTSGQDIAVQNPTVFRVESSSFYENMMRSADADLQRAFLESLKSEEGQGSRGDRESPRRDDPCPTPRTSPRGVREEISALTGHFVQSTTGLTSCIICTEDFSDKVRRPGWISLACLHEPSVCTDCMSKSIKSDLESKIWNQIKCPECSTLLVYEDIKRLADRETFSRYEVMSFRSAVGGDSNFVWCQKCDFGQLHESRASQPIVRCLNCGFRSCYVHSVAWHERLTCQEYDEMLQDPDGFQSAIDKEDEANKESRLQLEEDERLAQELSQRDKHAEEQRQRQRHEEQMMRARAQQAAEAERKKEEQEKAKRREEIKRKQMEDQLSMAKVQSTTKKCPGCQWPIEKNEGCEHMTCIKCRHEFCWRCMKNWKTHGGKCRY